MKKRIFRTLTLFSVLSVTVVALIITAFSVYSNMWQMERNLQETVQSIADSYTQWDGMEECRIFLDTLSDNIRATLIDADGTVLYETDAEANEMENHLDRPEIQAAIQDGRGEASRKSTTLNARTYYYAVRLDDGNVLRLAREYSNMYRIVFNSVIIILLWITLLIAVSVIASRRLTIWLIRPIVHLADHIGNLEDADVYDELEPFIRHIREQNEAIDEQKSILQRERETLNIVTRNMREGVLLISDDRNIISVNPSAIIMLSGQHARAEDYIGRTFLLLNRTKTWYECVDRALKGENAEDELRYQGAVYRLFASPILRNGRIDGSVVIVLDVTQKRLAEQMRREFSANVSHELKTPLTSISGYAEMMELGMVQKPEDQQEFARRIHKEALRLIALINDIIRLSRIEEGMPKKFQPVSLRQLCEETRESLLPLAEREQIALHITGDDCLVMGDPGMLTELLYNLSENAIKYNRPNGHVWITMKKQGSEAMLAVRDDGIGIPEESWQRVFERFYRVDKSRSKQTGGTGLGLSIVKHIVEYHDGRIALESELGSGTTIRVWLPLPKHAPQ
ncbi:MAG: ATP-binding protein [Eubacteriales bacterium]|nr:ATP-binding protein [Eubacteriales bacterium]